MKNLKTLFLSMLMMTGSICAVDIHNDNQIEKFTIASYFIYLFASDMSNEEKTIILERILDTCDLSITLSQMMKEVTKFDESAYSDLRVEEIRVFLYFVAHFISDFSFDEYNILVDMFNRRILYRSELTISEFITVINFEINEELFTEVEKASCRGDHFVRSIKNIVYVWNLVMIRLKEFGVSDLPFKAIFENEELFKKIDEICHEVWAGAEMSNVAPADLQQILLCVDNYETTDEAELSDVAPINLQLTLLCVDNYEKTGNKDCKKFILQLKNLMEAVCAQNIRTVPTATKKIT